uniref:Putative secreted protein n=1 Tax=Amblyomma triste TaxID=251400 RepID=A0A023G178_AMBTT
MTFPTKVSPYCLLYCFCDLLVCVHGFVFCAVPDLTIMQRYLGAKILMNRNKQKCLIFLSPVAEWNCGVFLHLTKQFESPMSKCLVL